MIRLLGTIVLLAASLLIAAMGVIAGLMIASQGGIGALVIAVAVGGCFVLIGVAALIGAGATAFRAAGGPPESRAARRASLERCISCGYTLRGLPHRGRCPECGFSYDLDDRAQSLGLDEYPHPPRSS